LSKNVSGKGCSAINYLSNGINILAKFGPKGIYTKNKDARFSRFTSGAIADLLVMNLVRLSTTATGRNDEILRLILLKIVEWQAF